MPTLADTQQLLWQLITAPEGVGAALAGDDDRAGGLRAALVRIVRGGGALAAPQRLDIYANMYFFRILDVLKEDYPATHALLGDDRFHNLITDYLLAYPPTHFSVREAGRHLPELLATHEAAAGHPCVAELASYERALNDAFDAADAPALSAASLAGVGPDAWPELRFTLHPSVRVLGCEWPVDAVRAAVDNGGPVVELPPATTRICVWRRDLTVFHRTLDELEYAALTAVQRGASFAEACAVANAHAPHGDAPQQVAAALAAWLSDGWLLAT